MPMNVNNVDQKQTPPSNVVAIPAPITRSIDQLLESIAVHQHQLNAGRAVSDSDAGTLHSSLSESSTKTDTDQQSSNQLAALIDMINRLHDGQKEQSATRQLVGDLASFLASTSQADVTVSLATVNSNTGRCRLVAASDSVQVDPTSEQAIFRLAAAQECHARSAISIWPAVNNSQRHALLAHQQLLEKTEDSIVVSAPLRLANQTCPAVVVCTASPAGQTESPEQIQNVISTISRFLNAAASPLAAALDIRSQIDRSWWQRNWDRSQKMWNKGRTHLVMGGLLMVSAAMFVPVDYRVTCAVELQPVSRRFIAAPFAAQLKTCLVESGDVVEKDQVLAELDGREIQWELSGILSDLEKAKKERNSHLSKRNSGLAAIARHEAQRLQNHASMLQERLSQLQIRSPISGVIVAGDLKDTEGAPLETGQSLFEVAPLDRMKVQIGIPEDDIRHVTKDMAARLQLDAMPSDSLDTTLRRIRPTAEIFNDENVFIAEAQLDNHDRQLRPGMRGQAKVSTGKKALGWNLFHKPTAWVVGWLGW